MQKFHDGSAASQTLLRVAGQYGSYFVNSEGDFTERKQCEREYWMGVMVLIEQSDS